MRAERKATVIGATLLILSLISPAGAESPPSIVGTYDRALAALESLPSYSGSSFSQWEGGVFSFMERDRREFEFCVRQSEGMARYGSESPDRSSETLIVQKRRYFRTEGSGKWGVITGDSVEFAPTLKKLFTDANRPQDLGVESVMGEPMRHLRGQYDVEKIVEREREKNRAEGGSLSATTEAGLRNSFGRSRFEIWIDAKGLPRKIRQFEYSDVELGGYQITESILHPGCDQTISEPPADEVYPEYRESTGLALVHRMGDSRREFHGGECYWVGQRGHGVSSISYTAPTYTLSLTVRTSGDQWNFYESLAERPELASASARWSLGDDLYRLEVPPGEVNLSSDLRSISFGGAITDHGQEGSRKRFPLDRQMEISFDLTCLNEPDSTTKENWDKKKEQRVNQPRVITIEPPPRRSGSGSGAY